MKVFISYSTDDISLVKQIADQIRPYAEVFYWDKSQEPGKHAWNQIFGWIDDCDAVVTVITDKTVARGLSVGQEVGHAKARQKIIFPLVAQDVPATELGCLHEVTYLRIERNNPIPAMQAVAQSVAKVAEQIKEQYFWIAVIGIIVLVVLLWKSK